MPPSYKLIYFNWKGRAEGARYIFHLAGQEFEDYRVTKEEWKQLKPSKNLIIQLEVSYLFIAPWSDVRCGCCRPL